MPIGNFNNSTTIQVKSTADNSGLDSAEAGVRRLGNATDESGKKSSFFKDNLGGAAVAATGLVAAIGAATVGALKQASAYQQSRVSFETMLGSADKAKSLLRQISDFAAATPFELPQVVDGAKNLLAFGVAGDDVISTFKTLGNVAAGVGTDKLPNLIAVFGQVKAAGRMMSQDMLQFTSAGVPMVDLLSQHFGIAKDKVKDYVENGKVGFDDLKQSLELLGGPTGKWGDLMDKQSKTLDGTLSNLSDNMGRILRQAIGIGPDGDVRKGSLFDIAIKGANSLLNSTAKLMPYIEKTVNFFEKNKAAVYGLVGAFSALAGLAIGALIVAFGTALLLMAAFAAAGAAIAIAAYVVYQNWNKIAAFFEGIKDKIVGTAKAIGDRITGYFNAIVSNFKQWGNDIANAWNVSMQAIGDTFKAVFRAIANDVIKPFIDMVKAILTPLVAIWAYELELIRGAALAAWWFIYNNIVKPVTDAIGTAAHWVGTTVSNVWNDIKNAAVIAWQSVYTDAISPVLNAIAAAANWVAGVLSAVWGSVSATAVSTWQTIGRWAQSGASIVVGAWQGMYGFFDGIWKSITGGASSAGRSVGGIFDGIANSIKNTFHSIINGIVDKINGLIRGVNGSAGKLPGVPKISELPHFAGGVNNFAGGWAVVGEQGPELAYLPKGANVYSNHDSKQMGAEAAGNTYHIQQVVLQSAAAVNEFFKIDRNTELAASGGSVQR